MPTSAGFEEKEYEGPLYMELLGTPPLWTPGQVLEGHLGFDAAMMCNRDFWQVVGRMATPGVVLAAHGLQPLLPTEQKEPMVLPDFRLNLFVQAKRPWRYECRPTEAVAANIGPPCLCFWLDEEQQQDLCTLANHLGDQAEVTYACASFLSKRELFDHSKTQTLIANSTFPTAMSLTNHGRWLYAEPGAVGVAASDPESIELAGLTARLQAKSEAVSSIVPEGPLLRLMELWRALLEVWADRESMAWAFELTQEVTVDGAGGLATRIAIVTAAAGLLWLTGGDLQLRQVEAR